MSEQREYLNLMTGEITTARRWPAKKPRRDAEMTCPQATLSRLIAAAIARHGDIAPCGDRATLAECAVELREEWALWYNDSTGSTHIIGVAQ